MTRIIVCDTGPLLHLSEAGAIVHIWSDYEVNFITNKNGEATFKVKFPDNITKWNSYVFAINNNKQSGRTKRYRHTIRNYKTRTCNISR